MYFESTLFITKGLKFYAHPYVPQSSPNKVLAQWACPLLRYYIGFTTS